MAYSIIAEAIYRCKIKSKTAFVSMVRQHRKELIKIVVGRYEAGRS